MALDEQNKLRLDAVRVHVLAIDVMITIPVSTPVLELPDSLLRGGCR